MAPGWGCLYTGIHKSPAVIDSLWDHCRSQIFYYSAGISVGLLASLLVLVYMMSKVMPKVGITS